MNATGTAAALVVMLSMTHRMENNSTVTEYPDGRVTRATTTIETTEQRFGIPCPCPDACDPCDPVATPEPCPDVDLSVCECVCEDDVSGNDGDADASGGEVDVSGGAVDVSGGDVDASGGDADASGGDVDVSGGDVDVSGGDVDVSGGDVDASGGDVDVSGGDVDVSGGDVDVSGGDVDVSGGDVDAPPEPDLKMTSLWNTAELRAGLGELTDDKLRDFASMFLLGRESTSTWAKLADDGHWTRPRIETAYEGAGADETLVLTLIVEESSYDPATAPAARGWTTHLSEMYADNYKSRAFRGIRSWGKGFPLGRFAWYGFRSEQEGVVVWPEGSSAASVRPWREMDYYFSEINSPRTTADYPGCLRELIEAVDTAGVTNLTMVMRHSQLNPDISGWDTSAVTKLDNAFTGNKVFNQPIGGWNTSAVTSMQYVFYNAAAFNQPLEGWDTAAVTRMDGMFSGARSFNQPIEGWDVGAVTNMQGMMRGTAFNQPLAGWDVSKVTNMQAMFASCPFNHPIGGWNTASLRRTVEMFVSNTAFNQPLEGWDVSGVTQMTTMFHRATAFNQPLNSWNVGNCIDFQNMFFGASAFDQPLDAWDMRKARWLDNMFAECPFNRDIAGWEVGAVERTNGMFMRNTAFGVGNGLELVDWVPRLEATQRLSTAHNMFADSGFSAAVPEKATRAAWEGRVIGAFATGTNWW